MTREIRRWMVASAVATALTCGLVVVAVSVITEDPSALVRYTLIRLTGVMIGLTTLSGGILFMDFITPDDWLGNIGKSDTASAMVLSAIVLVIGAILCWS